jgi:hypothetical protein
MVAALPLTGSMYSYQMCEKQLYGRTKFVPLGGTVFALYPVTFRILTLYRPMF